MTMQSKISAPFDSGDFPKSVLIQGDDIPATWCGQCGRAAGDWPAPPYGWGIPGAMFNADLYCASCRPFSYDENTGYLLDTLTGAEAPRHAE